MIRPAPSGPTFWYDRGVWLWRKDLIQPALDHETRREMDEQRAWIASDPGNPRPYFHLAQWYRLEDRHEEALALLLEAVRLEDGFAGAHVSLAEIYAIRGDYKAAWRHARAAWRHGDARAVELLTRHGVPEESGPEPPQLTRR